jgi:hypothetical protein
MKGLSYRNSTDVSGIPTQSMFGGAPIFVRTDGGLDHMPQMNNVMLESQNIPGAKFAMKPVSGKSDEA